METIDTQIQFGRLVHLLRYCDAEGLEHGHKIYTMVKTKEGILESKRSKESCRNDSVNVFDYLQNIKISIQ